MNSKSVSSPDIKGFNLNMDDLLLILDSITEAIYGVDENCNVNFCNTAFLKALGYENANEVAGKNIHNLIHHHYADGTEYPEHDCRINKMLKEKNYAHASDEVFWRADGTSFPVEYWAYPQFRNNQFNGNVVIFLDITERKLTQQELSESEQRFKELMDHVDAGVVIFDSEGNITSFNTKTADIFGVQKENLPGRSAILHDWKFVAEDHTPLNPEQIPLFQILEMGKPVRNKIIGVVRPVINDIVWVLVSGYPIKDKSGKILRVVNTFIDITERKLVEEVQFKNEKFLLETQRIANLGSYSFDIRRGKWQSSPVLDKIFGINQDIYHSVELWIEMLHPDWKQTMQDYLWNEVLTKKIPFDKQYQIVRYNDHEVRWVHGMGDLVLDENGNPIELVGTIMDITESKIAGEALRKSEEKYRQIVETSHEGIWMLDENGLTTFVNQRLADMLGYDRDEMNGKAMMDFINEDEKDKAKAAIDRRKDGIAEQVEFRFMKKNGDEIYVLVENNPIFENKVYKGSMAMLMDITNRRKAELENYLMVNETEENFVLIDTQYRIITFNKQFSTTYKTYFNREVKRGEFIYDYAIPERKEIVKELYKRVFNGERVSSETSVNLPDGVVTYSSLFKPTYDNKGNIVGAFVSSSNITPRKKIEDELRKSQAELRQLSAHQQTIREEEGRRIAREIHDELGQQLTGLKMDASWISKKYNKVESAEFEKKVNGMIHLIDEMVKSIRRIASELRPGILDDLGLNAALEWQSHEFEKRTEIKCKFETRLDDAVVNKNTASGIFRIYQEALTNIARHSKATMVEAKIEITDNFLVLQVKDNGQGFNVDAVRNKKTLGVVGMKERAIMLKGDLQINSAQNRGTIIRLQIPVDLIE